MFQINYDLSNIYQLYPPPQAAEQESVPAVLPVISTKNMAGDNNSTYAWCDEETKILLDFIQRNIWRITAAECDHF